jgi:hypothetical protein
MNRRDFLKVLGVGALTPFVKTEEKVTEPELYGVEPPKGTSIKFSNTPTNVKSLDLYYVDYEKPSFDYIVCEGTAKIIDVYRRGVLVHPSEYEIEYLPVTNTKLGSYVQYHINYFPPTYYTYTVIHFKKEQIDFSGDEYKLIAVVRE